MMRRARRLAAVASCAVGVGTFAVVGVQALGVGTASATGCSPFLGPYYGASCFVQVGANQYEGTTVAVGDLGTGQDVSQGECLNNTSSLNCQFDRVYTDSGQVVYEHCTGVYMQNCTYTRV